MAIAMEPDTDPTDPTGPTGPTGPGPTLAITSRFEMACAHHLPYHQGKCARPHGHNYILEFTRYGPVKPPDQIPAEDPLGRIEWYMTRPDAGMVLDFGDFDAQIKRVLDTLDHYSLNDKIHNPTAENLAIYLSEQLPLVDKIVVWETGRHCVTLTRNRNTQSA